MKWKSAFSTEWPMWALLAYMILGSAVVSPIIPDRIPMHWNLHGEIDRYGSKWEGLLMMPVVAVAVYVLMRVIPRIDPGRANYQQFASVYFTIRLAILAFWAGLHTVVLLVALGLKVDVPRINLVASGVLFLVLGNLMGKIRPNWFVGVRTPWTLSSKLSWTRTHRLGGRLFMLCGLVAFVAAMLPAVWGLAIFLSSLLLMTLGLVIYSGLVWKQDSDRIPPSGTSPSEND